MVFGKFLNPFTTGVYPWSDMYEDILRPKVIS